MVVLDIMVISIPSRVRVAHTALELRIQEWKVARPLACSDGEAKSIDEREMISLLHYIIHHNRDSEYSSLCFAGMWIDRLRSLAWRMISSAPEAETRIHKSTS